MNPKNFVTSSQIKSIFIIINSLSINSLFYIIRYKYKKLQNKRLIMDACTGLNNMIGYLNTLGNTLISYANIESLKQTGATSSWDETTCKGITDSLNNCFNQSPQACISIINELKIECC